MARPAVDNGQVREPRAAAMPSLLRSVAQGLSTHLESMRHQLQLLKTGARGTLTRDQQWSIDLVDRQLEGMQALARELLEVASLDGTHAPGLALADLGTVCREAADAYRIPMKQAGLEIHASVEPGLVVMAEHRRLRQVLLSLLHNALKFTRSGGSVTVTAARRGADAVVAVRDTGQGFRPEMRDRLFQPFSQGLGSDQPMPAGAGLGLFVARSVVALHGGEIVARSNGPGTGAEFEITLPLHASVRAAEASEARIRRLV